MARRVERLEAASRRREPVRAAIAELRAEYPRWERAADQVELLLDGAASLDGVILFLRHELTAELPDLLAPARRNGPGVARQVAAIRRVPVATVRLVERLPAEARAMAVTPQALTGESGSFAWAGELIRAASRLECRLPPDVAPKVMAAVATACAARSPGTGTPAVCDGCGLPRSTVEAAPACPHCGSPKVVSPRSGETTLAWQEVARRELDV